LPGLRHDEFSLIFSASGPMHLRSSQREMYQIGRNCTPATPMANQPKRAAKKPHFLESSLRKRDNFEPFRADVDLRQGRCPNCCKAKIPPFDFCSGGGSRFAQPDWVSKNG
jgi:hypothetical protein